MQLVRVPHIFIRFVGGSYHEANREGVEDQGDLPNVLAESVREVASQCADSDARHDEQGHDDQGVEANGDPLETNLQLQEVSVLV